LTGTCSVAAPNAAPLTVLPKFWTRFVPYEFVDDAALQLPVGKVDRRSAPRLSARPRRTAGWRRRRPPPPGCLCTTVCWKSCQTDCGISALGCPASDGVGAVSSSGTISDQLKMGDVTGYRQRHFHRARRDALVVPLDERRRKAERKHRRRVGVEYVDVVGRPRSSSETACSCIPMARRSCRPRSPSRCIRPTR